jgi:hypothetical protein
MTRLDGKVAVTGAARGQGQDPRPTTGAVPVQIFIALDVCGAVRFHAVSAINSS